MDPQPDLAAAIVAVQAELPKLERDRTVTVTQKNGDQYSYSYATLANVTESIMPVLARHGLAFVTMPGAGSDGKMVLRYTLMHTSGQSLTGEFPLSAEGGIQQLGGRITYARRYCLTALIGLAADEDDEGRLGEGGPATAQRAAPRPAAARRQRTAAPDSAPEPGGGRPAETAQRARSGPPLPNEAPAGPGEPHRGRGGLITEPMTRKLAISMKQALGDDSSVRKQYIVDMIGREVASSKDLTFEEGRGLIDAFEKANRDPDTAAATVIDIYRRTTGEAIDIHRRTTGGPEDVPAGRQPGQQSRNAREAIGNGGDEGPEPAPWEGALPV